MHLIPSQCSPKRIHSSPHLEAHGLAPSLLPFSVPLPHSPAGVSLPPNCSACTCSLCFGEKSCPHRAFIPMGREISHRRAAHLPPSACAGLTEASTLTALCVSLSRTILPTLASLRASTPSITARPTALPMSRPAASALHPSPRPPTSFRRHLTMPLARVLSCLAVRTLSVAWKFVAVG